MFVIAISQIFLAISLFAQMPWIKTIWPFDYTDDLSFIFMSSIAAAAAASTLWCVYQFEEAGFTGIALDYVAIFTALVIFSIQKYSRLRSSDLIPVIGIGIFVGIFGMDSCCGVVGRRFVTRSPRRARFALPLAFLLWRWCFSVGRWC
jgi:hypothetical protein